MYFWRLYSAHISSFICSADLLCTEQNIRGYTNNVLEVNQLNTVVIFPIKYGIVLPGRPPRKLLGIYMDL